MSEQKEEESSFFQKLGNILNAPLPGTNPVESKAPEKDKESDDDESLLEYIKEILNAPLPGTISGDDEATGTAGQSADTTTPPQPVDKEVTAVAEDTSAPVTEELSEDWWERDWKAFQAHQERERKGLGLKQRRDQEMFARYQEEEKRRFYVHQELQFEHFKQQQQYKMELWRQQIENMAAGQTAPPRPWVMAPPPPPPPPPGAPIPPWMRKK